MEGRKWEDTKSPRTDIRSRTHNYTITVTKLTPLNETARFIIPFFSFSIF